MRYSPLRDVPTSSFSEAKCLAAESSPHFEAPAAMLLRGVHQMRPGGVTRAWAEKPQKRKPHKEGNWEVDRHDEKQKRTRRASWSGSSFSASLFRFSSTTSSSLNGPSPLFTSTYYSLCTPPPSPQFSSSTPPISSTPFYPPSASSPPLFSSSHSSSCSSSCSSSHPSCSHSSSCSSSSSSSSSACSDFPSRSSCPPSLLFSSSGHLPSVSAAVSSSASPPRRPAFGWAGASGVRIFGQLPAVLLGVMFAVVDNVPYGLLIFPADRPELAPLGVKLVLLSVAASQGMFALCSKFPWGCGAFTIENVPLLVSLGSSVNERLLLSNHPQCLASTLIFIFALSSILTALVFLFVSKFKLGSALNEALPLTVLRGCVSGMGFFIATAGVALGSAIQWKWSFASISAQFGTPQVYQWGIGLSLEVFLLCLCMWRPNRQFLAPSFLLSVPLLVHVGLFLCGVSREEARRDGWLFDPSLRMGGANSDGAPHYTGPSNGVPAQPLQSSKDLIQSAFDSLNAYQFFSFSLVDPSCVLREWASICAIVFFSVIHAPLNIPLLSLTSGCTCNLDQEIAAHAASNFASGGLGTLQTYMTYSSSSLLYLCGIRDRWCSWLMCILTLGACAFGPVRLLLLLPRCAASLMLFHVGFILLSDGLVATYRTMTGLEYSVVCGVAAAMQVDFVFALVLGAFLHGVQGALKLMTVHTVALPDHLQAVRLLVRPPAVLFWHNIRGFLGAVEAAVDAAGAWPVGNYEESDATRLSVLGGLGSRVPGAISTRRQPQLIEYPAVTDSLLTPQEQQGSAAPALPSQSQITNVDEPEKARAGHRLPHRHLDKRNWDMAGRQLDATSSSRYLAGPSASFPSSGSPPRAFFSLSTCRCLHLCPWCTAQPSPRSAVSPPSYSSRSSSASPPSSDLPMSSSPALTSSSSHCQPASGRHSSLVFSSTIRAASWLASQRPPSPPPAEESAHSFPSSGHLDAPVANATSHTQSASSHQLYHPAAPMTASVVSPFLGEIHPMTSYSIPPPTTSSSSSSSTSSSCTSFPCSSTAPHSSCFMSAMPTTRHSPRACVCQCTYTRSCSRAFCCIVLDFYNVVFVDKAAAASLKEIKQITRGRRVHLAFSGMSGSVRKRVSGVLLQTGASPRSSYRPPCAPQRSPTYA
eukprot:GHVT01103133.1.p2 GENE.GHVT01103133.1~~GHVT01103133.1.p2  ORF type:complete len:1150 (-),score=256.66 GHVT01103133.1:9238-12687(-)